MPSTPHDQSRTRWESFVGIIGLVMGFAPHVLHHIGFFVGTALIAGSGGTLIFGVLGLVLSIPMLRRLHKRFGTWRAPAVSLLIFATMFALSTYFIGPMMTHH